MSWGLHTINLVKIYKEIFFLLIFITDLKIQIFPHFPHFPYNTIILLEIKDVKIRTVQLNKPLIFSWLVEWQWLQL